MVSEAVTVLILGVVAVLAGIVGVAHRTSPARPERPVLPSHYSSLLYANREHYPGHCTTCGTDNEPGYQFCENCGSQIPTSRQGASEVDVGKIVDD